MGWALEQRRNKPKAIDALVRGGQVRQIWEQNYFPFGKKKIRVGCLEKCQEAVAEKAEGDAAGHLGPRNSHANTRARQGSLTITGGKPRSQADGTGAATGSAKDGRENPPSSGASLADGHGLSRGLGQRWGRHWQ